MSKAGHGRQVTEQEFWEFIATYPRKLDVDVIGFCEPPRVLCHDFAIAEGWDAVVAHMVRPGTPLQDGTTHAGEWVICKAP